MLRSKYRGLPVVAVCTTIVGVLAIRATAHTQQSELSSFCPGATLKRCVNSIGGDYPSG